MAKDPSRLATMSTEMWLAAGGGLATLSFLLVAVLQPSIFDPDPEWQASDGCIGGLEHTTEAGVKEHYHPNLKITIDGEYVPIPPNTGIDQAGCREGMRWIHVHDSSETGFTKLHIETPSKMNVPLGAFFEVWERHGGNSPALTEDRKFDIDSNGVSDWEDYEITMKVNGQQNSKFEKYVMEDSDDIELTLTSK